MSEQVKDDGKFTKVLETINKSIGKMVDVVRSKPRAGKFWESSVEKYAITEKLLNKPILSYENNQDRPIAIRKISVICEGDKIFNIAIKANGVQILKPHKKTTDPYKTTNLQMDLGNGIEINLKQKLEVYVWTEDSNTSNMYAIISLDFGEA